MLFRLANWIVDYRWGVLAGVGIVTALAALCARHLEYDFTVEALFYGERGELQFSERFNDTFAHEDNLVVVVLEALGDDDVLTAAAIRWQADVATRLASDVPSVTQVFGLSTVRVPRPRLIGRSRIMMVPVIRLDEEIDDEQAELIRQRVADTPLLNGRLISPDAHVAAVAAYLDADVDEVSEVSVVIDAVNRVLHELPAPPEFRSHVTGLPAVRLDISQRLKSDQWRIVPICAGLFLCILLLMYRSLSGLIIPWLSIGVALCWVSGTLVLLDQPLNIVTNVLPVMVMVIGVSNCVHVVSYYSEQSLLTPGDRKGIAVRTLQHMGVACLLTCMTTAIGFASLLVADAEVLSGFGWQAAMAMGFLYLSTMLISGALMPMLKAPRFIAGGTSAIAGTELDRRRSLLSRSADALGRFAAGYPRVTLAMGLMVVAGAVLLGSRVQIDSKLIETYDEGDPTVRTITLAENKLGGFMPLEISLDSNDPELFQQAEIFDRVAQAGEYLRSLPEVTLVRSYVDLYQQLDRNLPGKPRLQLSGLANKSDRPDEAARRIRDADRLLSMPENADAVQYRDYLSADGNQGRISVHVRDIGIRQARVVYEGVDQRLQGIFADTGISVRLTGDAYYSTMALRRLIGDLFYSLVGAALVIFLVIALLFRSIRVAVAAFLPNTTPLLITLGYMGLQGYDMSISNVIVFAISLGIAVDDTIHFLARFRDEAEVGGSVDEIIHRTCLGTGRAIIMTSFLIIVGLSVVHLSEFVPTRRFAELTSVTMGAALLGDLLLLPACLKLVWPQRVQLRIAVPEEEESRRAAV